MAPAKPTIVKGPCLFSFFSSLHALLHAYEAQQMGYSRNFASRSSSLHSVFTDLTEAFDTVNRKKGNSLHHPKTLWMPEEILKSVQLLHNRMTEQVLYNIDT